VYVPKTRFGNIGDEGRREQVEMWLRRRSEKLDEREQLSSEPDGSARHYRMRRTGKWSGAADILRAQSGGRRADQSLRVPILPWRPGRDRLVPNAHDTAAKRGMRGSSIEFRLSLPQIRSDHTDGEAHQA